MSRAIVSIAICLLALASVPATAAGGMQDRYRWKDAQGVVHFDDVLSDAAIKAGYAIVNANGMTIRRVPPPKTDEQLKADAIADARKAAEQKLAAEQARDDAQMLAAYPDEQELVEAQQAQLAMIDQYVESTRISLHSQEKSLSDMLAHAADLERTGKPIPIALSKQIEALRSNIENQKNYIAAKQQEKIDSAAKFATELAHYRALKAKSAAKP
ncbi:MAG: DUF4124 domain-containing protein [Proteobacteria bacterium]|nr:DUF4124 domain-containing protein [Pseudomonadota bacterium]